MITYVGATKNACCENSIGTHNGIFHTDEVVGTAILDLVTSDIATCVVRTRDPEVLKELSIVIDVGGGEYDHHMKGFNRKRPTGEKYASAGLVWEKYGIYAIKMVMTMMKLYQVEISKEVLEQIAEEIDREFIIPVDQEDNGVEVGVHAFSFVSSYLPVWFVKNPDYDKAFLEAEKIAYSILLHIIQDKVVRKVTTIDLCERIARETKKDSDSLVSYGILEIQSQTMPWQEGVMMFNAKNNNLVKFVIFEYPAGGWAAQCVPPSKDNMFGQLLPFPAEWAGGNEKTLPGITGVEDASFCHNGRFFIRAKTREGVIRMCLMAMNHK